MRCTTKIVGLAALLVAACQGPDEYFRGLLDGGFLDGPPLAGQGGSATGVGGSGPGAGGMPTGLGGAGTGAAGSSGTGGAAGSGSPGNAGSGGSSTGAAGTSPSRGGTTGSGGAAGTSTSRGGTTGAGGSAGATGTGGRGGTSGVAGTAGNGGRGGATGAAGATGAGGNAGTAGTSGARGGTTGTGGAAGSAGTTGTGGGTSTVLYSDSFESDTVGSDTATGWSRAGGSSGDWTIATDGTKVLQQDGSTSSTVRMQSLTGATGSPWSGAVSASARVKIIAPGSNNQAALLCVRYNDPTNRYCGALVPGGVQILTVVGGTAAGSAVFSGTVATGTFYDLRVSVDASNVLTVYLGGTQKGTFTPASMTNGTVAVGTASMTATFDDISVTRP